MDLEMIATMAKKQSALRTLLQQMNVPQMRQDTTRFANIRWLNRNLRVNNGDHPMLDTAMSLVVWLLKEGS